MGQGRVHRVRVPENNGKGALIMIINDRCGTKITNVILLIVPRESALFFEWPNDHSLQREPGGEI